MARRHDPDDDRRLPLLARRSFLTAAGAGIVASLTGSSQPVRGQTATVDLGQEGLQDGDNIDPYLQDHFVDGNEVHIPAGEYQTELSWWDTSVTDATIVGSADGVTLRRPEGFWTDQRLQFDGHVVLENITFAGQLGQGRHRLRCEGQSSSAHMEFRNVNDPVGSIGGSDAIFMRAEGQGRITYRWVHLESYPNSAFYQLDNEPQQVFEGCTFRNSINIHRGGGQGYTIRDCLYISDGDVPEFCEADQGDCSDERGAMGGLHRFFKFDQGYSWDGGVFENLHYWCEEVPNNGPWMDFQGESAGTGGTMTGLCVYNNSGQNLFNFDGDHNWDVSDVHMSGSGELSVPRFFSGVTNGDSAQQPPSEAPVWTPSGAGHPLVDGSSGGGSGSPGDGTDGTDDGQSDGSDEDQSDGSDEEPSGSVFEVHSTDADAHIDYAFDVQGTAEPHEVSPDVSSVGETNDQITDNGDGTATVEGRTGAGLGDAFLVTGSVLSFERLSGQSGVSLLLDGEDVTDDYDTAGSGSGDDSGDGSNEKPSGSVFEVHSTDADAHIDYAFDVQGTAEPHEVSPDVSSVGETNDQITDNGDGTATVEGRTGAGLGDAFLVTGSVLSFERLSGQSGVSLLLDGEDVTDDYDNTDSGSGDGSNDSGDGSNNDGNSGNDGELPHRITIDGTGSPDTVAKYSFSVTGQVERNADASTLQDGGLPWDAMGDIVDNQHVAGLVGNGVDVYQFSGEVTNVDVDENATSQVVREE